MNKLISFVVSLLAIGSLVNGEQELTWVKPCGEGQPQGHNDGAEPLTDRVLVKNVLMQAVDALFLINIFKDQYVNETFKEGFMTHHNKWKDLSYDWLPKLHVPKSLGMPIDPDQLQNIQLSDFLRDAYRDLQILAVALDQVVQDLERGGKTAYQERFKAAMQRLRLVLCELLKAMKERNVEPHPDVGRDVMPDDVRRIDNLTAIRRNLRDWVIFRDYIVMLEYLKEVSRHFIGPKKSTDKYMIQGPMLWVNPCAEERSQRYLALNDTQMLQNIIRQAENALLVAESFKDQWVKETFHQEFMTHHNQFKYQSSDWLPKLSVSKSLGIPIDPSLLQNIQLDDFLPWTYTYLQTLSVALEQVAWDQGESGNTAYQERFRTVMLRIRLVLCEFLKTMKKRKVEPHSDVVREEMPRVTRHIDDVTQRNLRDWIIFRDCLSMLEYVKEVSKYFVDNSKSKCTCRCYY